MCKNTIEAKQTKTIFVLNQQILTCKSIDTKLHRECIALTVQRAKLCDAIAADQRMCFQLPSMQEYKTQMQHEIDEVDSRISAINHSIELNSIELKQLYTKRDQL